MRPRSDSASGRTARRRVDDFSIKVGDRAVCASQVDVDGPVPGERLVRPRIASSAPGSGAGSRRGVCDSGSVGRWPHRVNKSLVQSGCRCLMRLTPAEVPHRSARLVLDDDVGPWRPNRAARRSARGPRNRRRPCLKSRRGPPKLLEVAACSHRSGAHQRVRRVVRAQCRDVSGLRPGLSRGRLGRTRLRRR